LATGKKIRVMTIGDLFSRYVPVLGHHARWAAQMPRDVADCGFFVVELDHDSRIPARKDGTSPQIMPWCDCDMAVDDLPPVLSPPRLDRDGPIYRS
jgi:hypothetical protein